jgi:hypothetical protein
MTSVARDKCKPDHERVAQAGYRHAIVSIYCINDEMALFQEMEFFKA